MQKLQPHRRPQRPTNPGFGANVAALYNGAGDRYLAYADGGHDHLFDFAGLHGYADRQLWSLLQGKLADLRSGGAAAIRILDAGCGPGTWLRRCVAYARRIGFSEITARGFDLAQAQVETARLLSDGLAQLPSFDVADLTDGLPEPEGAVDIALCLYSVLSHLPMPLLRSSKRAARPTRSLSSGACTCCWWGNSSANPQNRPPACTARLICLKAQSPPNDVSTDHKEVDR